VGNLDNLLVENEKSLLKQVDLFEEAFAKGGNSDKFFIISRL
jgi:hypothetical protein